MNQFHFKIFLMIILLAATVHPQSVLSIRVDLNDSGRVIPDDFAGLSFEMEKLLPGKGGKYFFDKNNKALIQLFKTFGIKSLRVGGSTADRPSVPVPNFKDIDNFFGFVKAAGVKVIYTLRLREGNSENAAAIVKYINERYSKMVDCYAVGNEPNVFAKEYPVFKKEFEKYTSLIKKYFPKVKFCGPSITPGKAEWVNLFAEDFGKSGMIKYLTQHAYPGGGGNKVKDPAEARRAMLSKEWTKLYEKFYGNIAPALKSSGIKYRIEEANNFYNGGAANVSNTFAASLWGLDFLYQWAQLNSAGINFHTGDSVAAGEKTNPCYYASFVTSKNGYEVRPLGYAIRAFDLSSKGKLMPVKILSAENNLNVNVYAVLSGSNELFVTVINKEFGVDSKIAEVNLNLDQVIKSAECISLVNKEHDIAALQEITLGGAQINSRGIWNGNWEKILIKNPDKDITIKVPASSATVLKLSF